jgi:hypothetical protein
MGISGSCWSGAEKKKKRDVKVAVRSGSAKIHLRKCVVVLIKRRRSTTYGVKGERLEFQEL